MESTHYKITENNQNSYIYLDPVSPNKHENTLIFLHGLGDSAMGFLDVFADQQLVPPTCRVVLPTAPRKPVSCNNGYVMNSWFDIFNLNGKTPDTMEEIWKEYNQQDLKDSAELLLKMVDEEAAKFEDKDASRVFIGGFS